MLQTVTSFIFSKDGINFIALFLSPVFAVIIATLLQRKLEIKKDKYELFKKLLSLRGTILTREESYYINAIGAVFHCNKSVIKAANEFINALYEDDIFHSKLNQSTATDTEIQKKTFIIKDEKYLKLIETMSDDLGYKSKFDYYHFESKKGSEKN